MNQHSFKNRAWVTSPSELEKFIAGKEVKLEQYDSPMEEHGWICVGVITGTLKPLPFEEIKSSAEAVLREAISKLRTDTQVKVAAMEGMIANLLCLENNPSTQTANIFNVDEDGVPF